MKKSKGIVSLVLIAALLGLLGFTCWQGFGSSHTGSARNINLGLDLAGGVSITYQAKDKNPSAEDMKDTIYKLQKRVEQYSTEASVYQEGDDRINIEIPGVSDANKVLEELGKPGSLVFQDADGNTVLEGTDVKNAEAQTQENSTTKNKEYVVEGVRMVSEVPADLLVKIYMSERFHSNNPEYVHELVKKQGISSDSIEIVADNVFDRMSQTQTPQGIMAVVRMKDSSISDMLTDNPLLILVENLQDPGNLGTILRMGEGAGVTGVVMSSNTVDIYNPKTIRSTMGSIFRVPFVYVQDFSDAVSQCQNAGIKVYAAHLGGKNTYLGEDYREGTAFLIGNEGNGLTDDITKQADTLIRIPMQGEVESLNAAIACTILTYEAVRQRSV